MEESPALLHLCPRYASLGRCRTRVDSTYKNGILSIGPSVLPLAAGSLTGVQDMVANALGAPSSISTRDTGAQFFQTLQSKLQFDSRYRRAYLVNPAIMWPSPIVCPHIIAVALVTLRSANTTSRRLLATSHSHRQSVNAYISVQRESVTPTSLLCMANFGADRCVMNSTSVLVPTRYLWLCSAHNATAIAQALSSILLQNATGVIDQLVISDCRLEGCSSSRPRLSGVVLTLYAVPRVEDMFTQPAAVAPDDSVVLPAVLTSVALFGSALIFHYVAFTHSRLYMSKPK